MYGRISADVELAGGGEGGERVIIKAENRNRAIAIKIVSPPKEYLRASLLVLI